jgi:16S rRNA (adenine1518-N6/adenine1519-N6)-dimethyltransferase
VQTLTEIKAMLEERGLSPRHALGQNFLIEQKLITKLIDSAGAQPGDLVLEVGPGTGTLTEGLLDRGCRVIACELDRGLAELLRDRLGSRASFTLIEGDCLASGKRLNTDVVRALDVASAGAPPAFKLIANLPYQAATPLMLNLLIEHPGCSHMAVTIQREVAQRLGAPAGSKDYGLLGVVAQAGAHIEPVAKLPPECFWPRPEITSAMVLLTRRQTPLTPDLGRLASFCHTLFSKRRKQLGAILGRDVPFPPGIDPALRPENCSPEDLIRLMVALGTSAPDANASFS